MGGPEPGRACRRRAALPPKRSTRGPAARRGPTRRFRMTSAIVSVTLALAMGSTGGLFDRGHGGSGGWILPPLPGYGAGFPNGSPDGYGWFDYGVYLPLGADRTSEWYIQR